MVVSTSRHKSRSGGSAGRPAPAWHPPAPPQAAEHALARPLFAADVHHQLQSLGLSQAEAQRFLTVGSAALTQALHSIDHHAWTAAPLADQVSMLLPRFDIAALARACRLSKAEVQSGLALLVLNFVTLTWERH